MSCQIKRPQQENLFSYFEELTDTYCYAIFPNIMLERDFERALKLKLNKTKVRQFAIQQAMNILRDAEVVDPPLDVEVTGKETKASANGETLGRGLKQLEYAIEIPEVTQEVYDRVREEVENTGYNFVATIRSVSVKDLVVEDRRRDKFTSFALSSDLR